VTAPDIGQQGDVFGPYPATAAERERAVRLALGEQGPLRQVQMRAVRLRCPGCGEPPGQQCTQGRPGGRRLKRQTCHGSRVALSYPCPGHQLPAGSPCPHDPMPGEHQIPGACSDRQEAAKDALQMHAQSVLVAARARWQRDTEAASTQRRFVESRLTSLDPRG
jgi:hypothetical protein